MGGRLFTDKLVLRWLEGFGVWSLDSATSFPSAYPAHASGSPGARSYRFRVTECVFSQVLVNVFERGSRSRM
jgi:hypothetical protein